MTVLPVVLHAAIWAHGGHQAGASFAAWRLEPALLVVLLATEAIYLYAVGPLRRQRRLGPPVETWRKLAFSGSLVVAFLALTSPIDAIAEHYLFSIHMVQHMTLMMAVAPLLIAGTPSWIMRIFPHNDLVFALSRNLTSAMSAFLLSNAIFLVWHVPSLYEAALSSQPIHDFEHFSMLVAGLLMWWPVMGRIRALPALPVPAQLLYYFVLPVPASILGALITFSGDILYPTYAAASRLWEISARADQELAGLVMWVPGKLIFWLAFGVTFFRWFNAEEKAEGAPLSRDR